MVLFTDKAKVGKMRMFVHVIQHYNIIVVV